MSLCRWARLLSEVWSPCWCRWTTQPVRANVSRVLASQHSPSLSLLPLSPPSLPSSISPPSLLPSLPVFSLAPSVSLYYFALSLSSSPRLKRECWFKIYLWFTCSRANATRNERCAQSWKNQVENTRSRGRSIYRERKLIAPRKTDLWIDELQSRWCSRWYTYHSAAVATNCLAVLHCATKKTGTCGEEEAATAVRSRGRLRRLSDCVAATPSWESPWRLIPTRSDTSLSENVISN